MVNYHARAFTRTAESGMSEPARRRGAQRCALVSLAFSIAFLMVLPSGSIAAEKPDFSVFDGVLYGKWHEFDEHEEIDLIVQFENEVTDRDLATLRGLAFSVYERYEIIPGVHARGTKAAIAKLSNYHRTYWIEYNQQLKYFLDVSTTTIRAAQTWNRIMKDYAGAEIEDTGGVHLPVDGSGVTIVVADTGIDATHPDLDYQEKVVRNLKKDVNDPLTPWIELPNTDNLFGHGTHCAGISAGNGDASGGERKGVAPGATLIGLGIGDPWETNEVGCFEWVWENSRPDNNPYNIRVMTNSWGYEWVDASFKDAVIQASNRLTYENNVIVTFAAGNDGGDGSDVRTNPYGNQPGMISVAATLREGGGMAGFSSRGIGTQNATWPDIAAPGVEIWSPRDTTGFIVNAVAGDTNPYYTAISGTSMATPHVAGVAALLWQAAPSLRFTSQTKPYTEDHVGDLPAEWSEGMTDIHELELILDLTADYIQPDGVNGVPGEYSIGHHGRKHDFAQGYGMVNVEKAVALALTLEEMRKTDPYATVDDALPYYRNIMRSGLVQRETNAIQKSTNRFVEGNSREQVSWFGEVIELDEVFYPQENPLFVPQQAGYLIIDLNYASPELTNPQSGFLTMGVDKGNGEETIYLVPDIVDPSHARIVLDIRNDPMKGTDWIFEVHSLLGTRNEYRVNFRLVFADDGDYMVDEADYFRFAREVGTEAIPSLSDPDVRVTAIQSYFDLSKIYDPVEPSPENRRLTVTVNDPDVRLDVYRSSDPSLIMESAVTSTVHDFVLPADDYYFVKAQKEGYWDHTSQDIFLSRNREIDIPGLEERSADRPYIKFTSPGREIVRVSGVWKVGIDAGDEQGISFVEFLVNGKRVAIWDFPGHPVQTHIDYEWDTRKYDDGDYRLRVMVADPEGDYAEAKRSVEIRNDDDDVPWLLLGSGILAGAALVTLGYYGISRKGDSGYGFLKGAGEEITRVSPEERNIRGKSPGRAPDEDGSSVSSTQGDPTQEAEAADDPADDPGEADIPPDDGVEIP